MIGIKKQTAYYQTQSDKLNTHIKGMKAVNTLPKIKTVIERIVPIVIIANSLTASQESVAISKTIIRILESKLAQTESNIQKYLS